MAKLYEGRSISLLTRHGKERVIGPVLEEVCGCRVVHTDAFDTDRLGTFTRETPRAGSQREAAIRKARVGMELTGLSVGLASEGAFTADPVTGLLSWNVELVVLIDDVRGLDLVGHFAAPGHSFSAYADCWADTLRFARQAGFPDHHLVIRPDSPDHDTVRKGLDTLDALREAFDWARSTSFTGRVFLESDLRAHANPSRMTNIRRAARALGEQMNSPCPSCSTPGYWMRDVRRGRLCRLCGRPTREPMARIWSCVRCDYRNELPLPGPTFSDPGRCDSCNP